MKIDLDKIKKNLTDKKNIEYLEKVISDLKEENQKLIEQGDREFQKKVDEIDNLKNDIINVLNDNDMNIDIDIINDNKVKVPKYLAFRRRFFNSYKKSSLY